MKDIENKEYPTAFVSYSHDNQDHKDWVRKLSSDLRMHGVDVILDQWDIRLGDDLPFFMEHGLTQAHIVLCICSDNYTKKANANKGGVGYEKRILTADLIEDGTANYIIPIIRNSETGKIPKFLGAPFYVDFRDDSKYYISYRKLLDRIYNKDCLDKPVLGENPYQASHDVDKKIGVNLSIDKIKYSNTLFCAHVSFDYSQNNGEYIIGTNEYQFVTKWSTAGQGRIYSYKDKVKRLGYNPTFTEFPSLKEIDSFDFSSRCRTISEGQIFILENEMINSLQ